MRDEVKCDPRFSTLKGWYDNIEKRTELILENHTSTRSDFRSALLNYQSRMNYYFGHILEDLESHIKSDSSICRDDDVGVLLVKEFIRGRFKRFNLQIDNALNNKLLPKAGQFKIKECVKEFSISFDEFINRTKRLPREVNKVKREEGYPTVSSLPKDAFEPQLVERMVRSTEVPGVGTFHITTQIVGLDPRLLLVNDRRRYSKDLCDYILNNVLGSRGNKGKRTIETLEQGLISRHGETVEWITDYIYSTYYNPKISSSDESVAKVSALLEECNVYGADGIKSLIGKTTGKRRRELRELLKE